MYATTKLLIGSKTLIKHIKTEIMGRPSVRENKGYSSYQFQ